MSKVKDNSIALEMLLYSIKCLKMDTEGNLPIRDKTKYISGLYDNVQQIRNEFKLVSK